MKILKNRITDYISANFSENETAWDSAAIYNYADEVRDGHFIYKYAGANGTNTTDAPSIDSQKLPTERKWVQICPTNYFAMLDGVTSTQTKNTDTITIEIAVDNYDALSLLDVVAQSVSLELRDATTAEVFYTKTIGLLDYTGIVDFYSYCFEEIVFKPSVYIDDMPLVNNAILRIVIDNNGGEAACGRLVCGKTYYIGKTGYGVNLSQESYSKKDTDVFGNTTLIHSNSLNIDSYEVYVPTQSVPNIRRKFKELDAVALLFIMDENPNSQLENLLNFGFYQNFSIVIPDAALSTASLQIKGLL